MGTFCRRGWAVWKEDKRRMRIVLCSSSDDTVDGLVMEREENVWISPVVAYSGTRFGVSVFLVSDAPKYVVGDTDDVKYSCLSISFIFRFLSFGSSIWVVWSVQKVSFSVRETEEGILSLSLFSGSLWVIRSNFRFDNRDPGLLVWEETPDKPLLLVPFIGEPRQKKLRIKSSNEMKRMRW